MPRSPTPVDWPAARREAIIVPNTTTAAIAPRHFLILTVWAYYFQMNRCRIETCQRPPVAVVEKVASQEIQLCRGRVRRVKVSHASRWESTICPTGRAGYIGAHLRRPVRGS